MIYTNDEVVAEVSPRSVGGTSLFETPAPITADNVGEFRSEDSDVADASYELRQLGFQVLQESPTTISISGPSQLFQDVFSVELQKETMEVTEGMEVEFFAPPPDEPSQQLLQAPGDLSNLIEGVAISRPPELLESALPPIADIHPDAYRYLFVPDEVALLLGATRAHRLGTTGRDVVVAMIDSGHYRHPFFTQHGYRLLPTLLGPGDTDPGRDDNGHGTGESANIFAAAPDIRLRPVKGLRSTTGSFNAAVNSTPRPRVITNSWGYDIDRPGNTLPPDLKPLEAAVANAVAGGIVVCFSAGNGQRSWPGSHPNVISVGGVHVNYPNLDLEASSYASSFRSNFYPGRRVPDLCGLTGRRVDIEGNGRAPSLMLPVQPGSTLDGISPSTGAANDGWGLFSGTSAACPQVAGIVALLLQRDQTLTPARVKDMLIRSARDVSKGRTGTGDLAGTGPDLATGAGLVDARWAWVVTMADVAVQFFAAPAELQAEMAADARMPQITTELVADIMDILRSR